MWSCDPAHRHAATRGGYSNCVYAAQLPVYCSCDTTPRCAGATRSGQNMTEKGGLKTLDIFSIFDEI